MTGADRSVQGPQGQDRAREVVVEVAASAEMQKKHPMMSKLCDVATLEAVVNLAWRHQFDDRYGFKRDVRELQQHVSGLAASAMEMLGE